MALLPTVPVIQTIPQGLLGLLQLKEMGKNPDQLSLTVTPQVDLFPLWIQRNQTLLVAGGVDIINIGTSATGQQLFATKVPQNQAWYVISMTADYSTGAATDFARYAPGVQYAGNGFLSLVAPDVTDAITARQRRARSYVPPFWAPPGTQFGIYVFDVLAATTVQFFLAIQGVAVPI
jgi:hypothetical protein